VDIDVQVLQIGIKHPIAALTFVILVVGVVAVTMYRRAVGGSSRGDRD